MNLNTNLMVKILFEKTDLQIESSENFNPTFFDFFIFMQKDFYIENS